MNLKQFKGYTNGPWVVDRWLGFASGEGEELQGNLAVSTQVDESNYVSIAMVQADSDKPAEANMKLIAAAPELLDYARKLEAENKRLKKHMKMAERALRFREGQDFRELKESADFAYTALTSDVDSGK
jgi:hypothetical protein